MFVFSLSLFLFLFMVAELACLLVAKPGCWPAVVCGAWVLPRSWWRSWAAGPSEAGCWPAVGGGAWPMARSWLRSLAAGPQLQLGWWLLAAVHGSGAWLLAVGCLLAAARQL